MALFFKKSIEADGWSFDRRSGELTIKGSVSAGSAPFRDIEREVRSVTAVKGARAENCSFLFSGMRGLKTANLSELDISECRDLSFMFAGCTALETLNIMGWVINEDAKTDGIFDDLKKTIKVHTDDVSVVRLLPGGIIPVPFGSQADRFNTALALDNAGRSADAARQYQLLADEGHVSSLCNLAVMYHRGEGVEKDEGKSLKLRLRAAELGHATSMFIIAGSYQYGEDGFEKDLNKALYWARRAKESGELSSDIDIDKLIRILENDIAFEAARAAYKEGNYLETERQYRIAIDKGSSAAAWNLALMYSKGEGVQRDPAEAYALRLRAANMGSAGGQYYMAESFHKGDGFPDQDDEEALVWAKKAKENKRLSPQRPIDQLIQDIEDSLNNDPYNLGKAAYRSEDYLEAMKQWKNAAEQGNANAAWRISSLYANEEGYVKSYEKILSWQLRAAELGLPKAMYAAAENYYYGKYGSKQDLDQALIWAEKAKESQRLNIDVPVDNLIKRIEGTILFKEAEKLLEDGMQEEALNQYRAAGEKGHPGALLKLAVIYDQGKPAEHEEELALHYYALASESGDREASDILLEKGSKELLKLAAEAFDSGDRRGALYAYHAAFRTYIMERARGLDHYTFFSGWTNTYADSEVYFTQSMELLKEEAEKGIPWAEYYLGWVYWGQEGWFYWKPGAKQGHEPLPEDPFSAVPYIEKAYSDGLDQPLMFMAARYLIGDHGSIPQNRDKAALLLSRASKSFDLEVKYDAANRYWAGLPEETEKDKMTNWYKDPQKALELMTELAGLGHQGAMYDLYRMYDTREREYPNDSCKMMEYLRMAAEGGHKYAKDCLAEIEAAQEKKRHQEELESYMEMGYRYFWGLDGKYDINKAISYFKKAASEKAEAARTLGDIYIRNFDVPRDYVEAAKWYLKAAELGDLESQGNIASMYRDGVGVPQDKNEAFKWFKKAAEAGDHDCQYDLAKMYYEGDGIPRNPRETAKWLRKLAESGDKDGLFDLGNLYYSGEGVFEDEEEAAKLWREAADQGYAKAMYKLGLLAETGSEYVSKSEGLEWLNKAADLNFPDAIFELSKWYRKGKLVEKDLELSKKYLKKAAELGSEEAIILLKNYEDSGVEYR